MTTGGSREIRVKTLRSQEGSPGKSEIPEGLDSPPPRGTVSGALCLVHFHPPNNQDFLIKLAIFPGDKWRLPMFNERPAHVPPFAPPTFSLLLSGRPRGLRMRGPGVAQRSHAGGPGTSSGLAGGGSLDGLERPSGPVAGRLPQRSADLSGQRSPRTQPRFAGGGSPPGGGKRAGRHRRGGPVPVARHRSRSGALGTLAGITVRQNPRQ